MARLVEMPKLSDTMEEGGISEWLKKEGDFVEEGDPLLSIETDKATMEYASPEEGFLLKILVEEKSLIALGSPIAVLGEKNEKVDVKTLLLNSVKEESKVGAQKKEKKPKAQAISTSNLEASHHQVKPPRVKASPLAKKIAKSKGLDLTSVTGSGPFGRVVAKDLEERASLQPERGLTGGFPVLSEKIIPLTAMRKTIARRLSESKHEAPHFYLTVKCKTAELSKWRKLLNKNSETKISMNDLLLFICSRALTKHPEINSHWLGDSVRYCGSVDLSVAVALPEGLITPVLRSCEKKNIWQISKESKELIAKARSKNLTAEEYSGGSFTLSNLGMTRVESFTAVINAPETCILAIGRSRMEACVQEDGSIRAEEAMNLTLSCDHRAVDGYMGALFLETLTELIEAPLLLFS